MKILFLLTSDLQSPAGLGRYWPLARGLARSGHQVRIATLHSQWQALKEKTFMREGVIIQYVSPMHVMKDGNQKTYYSPLKLIGVSLMATLRLSQAAISSPADIIHVGKPHPMNSIAGLLASRLRGKTLCLDCDDYEAATNRFEGSWQKAVVEFFEKKMPRLARLVTTNTYYMMSMLSGWGCPKENIYYLSNGVDKERFVAPSLAELDLLRTRLGLVGKRIVLYIGTLSLTSHPIDLLLKAYAQLSSEHPGVELLIVGGGEDLEKLKDLSKALGVDQSTHFTGRVDPDEVNKYYHLADVSVDPVKDDGSARGRAPLKLFESWASGVPFVSAAVGDRPYLVGQPPAGVLVEPAGDPQALAKGIQLVLDSPELALQIRQRGLERVEHCTWEKLAADLEKQYQNLR